MVLCGTYSIRHAAALWGWMRRLMILSRISAAVQAAERGTDPRSVYIIRTIDIDVEATKTIARTTPVPQRCKISRSAWRQTVPVPGLSLDGEPPATAQPGRRQRQCAGSRPVAAGRRRPARMQ